ncbi:class I SAM-dependent RNA methyltransferase [Lachnospiraceae bacterium OttesenSCG-928-E19]|nr:class I SAM-dependent RNA methyltransferase [Lachnospiraceae bacterium OttesenSCG-928-E19]
MKKIELIAPCHFGLEAVLKREILDLGYEIARVEDGRVTFYGDADGICFANIFLRSAERILLKVGEFKAVTFDELFEKTKELPWEEYIPKNGKFWVKKAASVKSKLFSPSDIQSIMKKAMVDRLKESYHVDWFSEDGAEYPIRVFLMKDMVTIGIDTTGTSLHKRGYREKSGIAPITETLAASLIMLTPWKSDRILVDPFCGSGTFPIEAAMIAANIAPGMNRTFTAQAWENLIPKKNWDEVFEEANDVIERNIEVDIQGYDIDGSVIRVARENAKLAGVEKLIHFQERGVKDLNHPKKYGFVITNPPYGERLEDKEALPALYREFGESFMRLDSWSAYMITSYEDTERYFGRKADKNRKLYNGMIKTYFYQFQGPKPPRRKEN